MSARLSLVILAGFCLAGISACDSKQAPVEAATETAKPVKVAEAPEFSIPENAPALVDPFLLENAVKESDTLESLRKQYGEANVVEGELPGAEGETAQGWIIFPNDADKKLMIYPDETNKHPGTLLVDETTSKWHFANAIEMGTDAKTLQSLNKKTFLFYGFYWDYGGVITDWNKGELDKNLANGSHLSLHLCPPEDPKLPENYLSGDGTFKSDDPMALKFPPVVCQLGLYFAQPE